jgi:hypothetical protein
MAETSWDASDLDAAVRELAGTDVVAFGGVGIAGATLPATAAYRLIEQALPSRADQVRQHLTWLLAHGTAAGRAYAATLLTRCDAEAGRSAWEALLGSPEEFTTYTGCIMGRTSLGDYAAAQLQGV